MNAYDVDIPRGWSRESGYRLNAAGKSIEYLAGGCWSLQVHASSRSAIDGLMFEVLLFERNSDPTEGMDLNEQHAFMTKEAAAERAETVMQDLQHTLTAETEEWRNAYRNGVSDTREVSGVSHDGAIYCLPCAVDDDAIDVSRYIRDPESVAYGGPLYVDRLGDYESHCTVCHRQIEGNSDPVFQ